MVVVGARSDGCAVPAWCVCVCTCTCVCVRVCAVGMDCRVRIRARVRSKVSNVSAKLTVRMSASVEVFMV